MHYRSHELRALMFASVDDVNSAIDYCWDDPHLQGIPRWSPDGMTMFVPADAVPYFQEKGNLNFKVTKLVDGENTPQEDRLKAKMRYWRGEE